MNKKKGEVIVYSVLLVSNTNYIDYNYGTLGKWSSRDGARTSNGGRYEEG